MKSRLKNRENYIKRKKKKVIKRVFILIITFILLLSFNLYLVGWFHVKYNEIKVGLLYPIISLADNIYDKKIKKKINEKNKFIYINIYVMLPFFGNQMLS